jgi:hypothetical protein|tara:strand:+ start:658 stop:918 length:261 start_codon:yes stop_codon:yes gene_type:complete
MTELVLPVTVLVAAATMTYSFCLRPMRKGHACHQSTSRAAEAELDRALREARLELDRLRTTPAAERTASSRTDGLPNPRPYTSASD